MSLENMSHVFFASGDKASTGWAINAVRCEHSTPQTLEGTVSVVSKPILMIKYSLEWWIFTEEVMGKCLRRCTQSIPLERSQVLIFAENSKAFCNFAHIPLRISAILTKCWRIYQNFIEFHRVSGKFHWMPWHFQVVMNVEGRTKAVEKQYWVQKTGHAPP